MVNYYSIQSQHSIEIEIKKSRFITYLFPISSEEEVAEALQALRTEHPKANHHCYAYVYESDSQVQRMNDDGEPTGTAGVPMLEVILNHQLTNILAVTVRYFGGTKLGSGGLIRAYRQGVNEAIQSAPWIKNVDQLQVELLLDYSEHDRFTHYLSQTENAPILLDTQYGAQVTVQMGMNPEDREGVYGDLMNLLNGQLTWHDQGTIAIDVPYHPTF